MVVQDKMTCKLASHSTKHACFHQTRRLANIAFPNSSDSV